MLIFATIQGLEFLVRSKNMLGDGTFETAPNGSYRFIQFLDRVKIGKYRSSGNFSCEKVKKHTRNFSRF